MATGNVTVTTAAAMIPEIWIPQVDLALQTALKFRDVVRFFGSSGNGSLGDKIHIPKLNFLTARDKSANTEYTFDVSTDTDNTITIDTHKYHAIRIEGVTRVESSYEQVANRVQQVVYPVAKALDTSIAALHSGISANVDAGAISTSTAVAKMIDLKVTFDEADVPDDGRYLIVSPYVASILLQTTGFISRDYIDGRPVATGTIGTLFGFDIIVSNNVQQASSEYKCIAGVRGMTLGLALAKDIAVRAWDEPRGGHDTVGMSCEAIYGVGVLEASAGCVFRVDVPAE